MQQQQQQPPYAVALQANDPKLAEFVGNGGTLSSLMGRFWQR